MSKIRRKKVNLIGFLIAVIITGIVMFALLNRVPIYGIASNVLVIIPEGKTQSYAQHITGNVAGIIQNAFDDGKIAGIPTEIVVKKLKDSGVINIRVYEKDATEAFKMHKLLMNSIEKEVVAFYPKSMGIEVKPVGQSYKVVRLSYVSIVVMFSIVLGWLLSLHISELVDSVFAIRGDSDEEYEELYSENDNLERTDNFDADGVYTWSDLKNDQNYKYQEGFEEQNENEQEKEEFIDENKQEEVLVTDEKEKVVKDLEDNFQNLNNEVNPEAEINNGNLQNNELLNHKNEDVLEEDDKEINNSFKNKINNFKDNLKKSVENIKKENKKLNSINKEISKKKETEKVVDNFFKEETRKSENEKAKVLENDLNLINSERNAEYLNSLGPLGINNKKGNASSTYEYTQEDYVDEDEQIKEIRSKLNNNLASLNKIDSNDQEEDIKEWNDITKEVSNQFREASLSEGEELNFNKELPLEEIVHTGSNITGEVDENLFSEFQDVETLTEEDEKIKQTLTGSGFKLPQIEEKYAQVKNTQKELSLETEEQTKNQSSKYTNAGSTNSIPGNLPIVEINDINEVSDGNIDKEGEKMVEDFEKEPSDEELKRRLNELLNGSM